MNWFEKLLDRLFEKRVIVNCDRDPYLHRWYLFRTKPFAVFLHKFVRSDEDRALHSHPWPFVVIPVWRGYTEHSDKPCGCWICEEHPIQHCSRRWIPITRRVLPIISARFRRAIYRHRVELINGKPSWSIFIRFKECREWGFHPPEGFVHWKKWWQDKCE